MHEGPDGGNRPALQLPPAINGRKRVKTMSEYYYDTFDCNTHAEEIYNTDPDELAEGNRLIAEHEWEGYGEWSEELEAQAWAGAARVETSHGAVMVKPECSRTDAHRDCSIYQCKRAVRLEGIDV